MTYTVFPMFQTQFLFDFSSASRSSETLGFAKQWDFQSKDVASGIRAQEYASMHNRTDALSIARCILLRTKSTLLTISWETDDSNSTNGKIKDDASFCHLWHRCFCVWDVLQSRFNRVTEPKARLKHYRALTHSAPLHTNNYTKQAQL
jgi:hypothetical protein